ncbi:nucleoside phosphorylase [Paludisphaera borealis]|uniref:5'-methylthioadenosine/S-adenosylhomocysteine nucleosidase n=1 Tax=Paludisphaera borealis TaxID=1387353 RepID=A0A1U7CVF0_9BACT|nr:nucleoside phosphorylase [Paludisphaera borealis]APW62930.1 5'-methylthioadenosine/S-adenosylhomocysteine nucleosidase [Paludisphaera borealis]
MRDPEPQRLAPAPAPADIGVVMAMPIEAGYLLDRLERVRRYNSRSLTVTEGELDGRIVAVIVSGVGRASARRGAEHLMAGHRPRVLVSAGFAGALDVDLKRNDLVAPRIVIDGAGDAVEIDEALVESLPGIVKAGRLLLVDRVITDPGEKAALRLAHQADLIDMETFSVAAAARDQGAPFVSLRVISDDARTELPAEIGRLLNTSGTYRVGAAMRAIWSRPSSLKDFWTLHAQAMESSDRLANGLQVLIRGLA